MNTFFRQLTIVAMCTAGLSAPTLAAEAGAADEHAHHDMTMQMMQMTQGTKSTFVEYKIPHILLVRADGKPVALDEELNDGRPVVMNFIFTTCTTVCPLTSRTFEELQDKLGKDRSRVHMVSISIDPEQDTPAVLTKYSHKYGAKDQWQFYTGTADASIAAQRAFDVYRGGKMKHNPVTLIRSTHGDMWLRVEGFAKADELLHDLGELSASASEGAREVADNESH